MTINPTDVVPAHGWCVVPVHHILQPTVLVIIVLVSSIIGGSHSSARGEARDGGHVPTAQKVPFDAGSRMVRVLAREARCRNTGVDDSELATLRSTYRDTAGLGRRELENFVLASKYLRSEHDMAVSPTQLKSMLNSSDKTDTSAAKVYITELDELATQLDERRREREAKARAGACRRWEAWELALNIVSDTCLAVDPNRGNCIMDARAYNAALPYVYVPRRITDRAAARYNALERILETMALARVARESQTSGAWQAEVASLKRQLGPGTSLNLRSLGRPERLSEDQLWDIYGTYHEDLFAPREYGMYRMVCSSDSLVIERLGQILRDSVWVDHPRFAPIAEGELPRELRESALELDTLGQCSNTFATPWGYCVVQLDSLVLTKERRFETVRGTLVHLSMVERHNAGKKPMAARTIEYYDNHRDEFRRQDTVSLVAWVFPRVAHCPLADSTEEKRYPEWEDTNRVAGKSVTSLGLPVALRHEILAMRECLDRDSLVGPFRTPNATWFARVTKWRTATGYRSFVECRDEITQMLTERDNASVQALAASDGNWFIDDLATAKAYRQYRERFCREMSDKPQVDSRGRDNRTKGLPPLVACIQSVSQELSRGTDQWISGLEIGLQQPDSSALQERPQAGMALDEDEVRRLIEQQR